MKFGRVANKSPKDSLRMAYFTLILKINQHPAVLESAAVAVPADESEDEIKVVVAGARFDLGVRYHDRKYGGTELATTLGKSQNLTLTVKYDAPERMPMKLGGAVVRRDDL